MKQPPQIRLGFPAYFVAVICAGQNAHDLPVPQFIAVLLAVMAAYFAGQLARS